MAEYADLSLNSMLNNCPNMMAVIRCSRVSNHQWETRDGTKVDIKEMSTMHIRNAIRRCKGKNWRAEWIPILEAELKRRFK